MRGFVGRRRSIAVRSRGVFRSIYFDCDSTLATIEGVEEVARGADDTVRQQVAQLTAAAMAKNVENQKIAAGDV